MKKIITFLIAVLVVQAVSARKITLTKTGGSPMSISQIPNSLLTNTNVFSNGIPANGSVSNSTTTFTTIVYEEGQNGLSFNGQYNWSEVLRLFSELVNYDPDAKTGTAYYLIEFGDYLNQPTYKVGKQMFNPSPANNINIGQPYNVLYFTNSRTSATGSLKNITINGTKNDPVQIEYVGNMYYGGWLAAGQSYSKSSSCSNNTQTNNLNVPVKLNNCFRSATPSGWQKKVQAHIGVFIYMIGCEEILIKDIHVDGRIQKQKVGGPCSGSANMQQSHTGIIVLNTNHLVMKKSTFNNFGLDGAIIRHTSHNIRFEDCEFEKNGRQGLSWTGGSKVNMVRCKFNKTGKNDIGHFSPPSSGVDIEPSFGYTCIDGEFTNCEFVDDISNCLVQDSGFRNAKNMTFKGCKFHNIESNKRAIWVKGRNFYFEDCDIWGGFVHGNKENIAGYETRFKNCRFEDKALGAYSTTGNAKLLHADRAKRMLIEDCTFSINTNSKAFIYARSRGTSINEFIKIKNSTFIYKTSPSNSGAVSWFRGVVFDGKNSITNQSNNFINCYSDDLVFEGNDDPCDRNLFETNGQVQFRTTNTSWSGLDLFQIGYNSGTGTLDKYCDFNINENSAFVGYNGTNIEVGLNSSINVNENGYLLTRGGKFNNNGKIVFGNGSKIRINNTNNLSTSGSEFYIHDNISGSHPLWTSAISSIFNTSSNWNNMKKPTDKYDGGRVALTNSLNSTDEFEALDFTNGRVILPQSAKLDNLVSGNFSIETSFKARTNYAGWGTLFERGTDIHLMVAGNGRVILSVNNANWQKRYYYSVYVKDDKCHKLVITFDNTTGDVKLYIDNVFKGSPTATYSFNPTSTSQTNVIGSSRYAVAGNAANPYCYKFHGWIGEVRLWDRVLTSEDVCYNYKRKTPFSQTGLVADWDFRETSATSTVLKDRVLSNPSDGNLYGVTPTWVSQNTLGSCFTEQNTNDVIGSFKTAPGSNIKTIIEPTNSDISIYPNPVLSELKVLGTTEGNVFKILDITGKLIKNGILKEDLKVDVTGISSGIYLIGVGNAQNFKFTKFIKE